MTMMTKDKFKGKLLPILCLVDLDILHYRYKYYEWKTEHFSLPLISVNERLCYSDTDSCIVHHHRLVSIAKVSYILLLHLHTHYVGQTWDHCQNQHTCTCKFSTSLWTFSSFPHFLHVRKLNLLTNLIITSGKKLKDFVINCISFLPKLVRGPVKITILKTR